MNILTLTLIIMETKEQLLAILQNLGFSFCISNPIQQGTWVFKMEKIPSPPQKIDIQSEIDYHFNCMVAWHKNWLTVYPEIKSQTLNNFQNVADKICKNQRFFVKTPLIIREQENLSGKQFIVKVNFNISCPKKILKEICWQFQIETDTFCKLLPNNEFLIDCDTPVDYEAINQARQAAIEKKLYADECGKLSRRLDIPFANVLALGTDEKLLERHALTMTRAAGLIAAQDKIEKKLLYFQLFKGNKENKEQAIKSLGIEIGNADVMKIDFSVLEEAFK